MRWSGSQLLRRRRAGSALAASSGRSAPASRMASAGQRAGQQRLADALAGQRVARRRPRRRRTGPGRGRARPGRCGPGWARPCAVPRRRPSGPSASAMWGRASSSGHSAFMSWTRRSAVALHAEADVGLAAGQRERPRVAGEEVGLEPHPQPVGRGPGHAVEVLPERVPLTEVAGRRQPERLAHGRPHAVGGDDVAAGHRAERRRRRPRRGRARSDGTPTNAWPS